MAVTGTVAAKTERGLAKFSDALLRRGSKDVLAPDANDRHAGRNVDGNGSRLLPCRSLSVSWNCRVH